MIDYHPASWSERLRWSAAIIGCAFAFFSTWMPIVGMSARHVVRCRDRHFTGRFDDCFNDYLPFLEMAVPLLGFALLYPFAMFAAHVWAPDREGRALDWRLAGPVASKADWSGLHLACVIGAVWAGWQARAYWWHPDATLFLAFWLGFAAWFLAGLLCNIPRRKAHS